MTTMGERIKIFLCRWDPLDPDAGPLDLDADPLDLNGDPLDLDADPLDLDRSFLLFQSLRNEDFFDEVFACKA